MTLVDTITSNSNIPQSLVRAVIRQIGGAQSFKESAHDIANHGIDGGVHGFIYHVDTTKFSRNNLAAILELADAMARDMGESSGYQLVAGFNCLRDLKLDGGQVAAAIHDKRDENHTEVMNALAWFAGEEVARAYADQQ